MVAVGDPVFFAGAGATVVSSLATLTLGGTTQEYAELRLPYGEEPPSLTVQVPVEQLVPLSALLGTGGVAAVLAVLAEPGPHEEPATWEERYAFYAARLGIPPDADADPPPAPEGRATAELVRNLSYHAARRGLSAGEHRLLQTARTVLVSEVALGTGVDVARATAFVDDALAVQREAPA